MSLNLSQKQWKCRTMTYSRELWIGDFARSPKQTKLVGSLTILGAVITLLATPFALTLDAICFVPAITADCINCMEGKESFT
jgi:hypothetical protein